MNSFEMKLNKDNYTQMDRDWLFMHVFVIFANTASDTYGLFFKLNITFQIITPLYRIHRLPKLFIAQDTCW